MPNDKLELLRSKNPAFAKVVEKVIDTHISKAADYTHSGNPFSNFQEVAEATNVSTGTVLEMFIAVKSARLKALRKEDKTPNNESIYDSMLDRAVYSLLACAWWEVCQPVFSVRSIEEK